MGWDTFGIFIGLFFIGAGILVAVRCCARGKPISAAAVAFVLLEVLGGFLLDLSADVFWEGIREGQAAAPPPAQSVPAGAADWRSPYPDVREGAWYYDAVAYMAQHGLMHGYDNGRFGPADVLSRCQLAQILYNLEGQPTVDAPPPFPDVSPNAWYAQAVAWANQTGVAGGYGTGCFGPSDPVTREQLALMLWRYAGSPRPSGALSRFPDGDEAHSWAGDALAWAVGKGVLAGRDGGLLHPQGEATRGEVAAVLQRFLLGDGRR